MQNEVNYNKLLIDVLDSIEGKEISPDPCDPESGPSPNDIEFAPLCAEMILRHIDCNYLQLMGFRGGKISYRWLTGPEANTIQTCNENFLRTQCVIVYDPREKEDHRSPAPGTIVHVVSTFPFLKGCSITEMRLPPDVDLYCTLYNVIKGDKKVVICIDENNEYSVDFNDNDCGGFESLKDPTVNQKLFNYFKGENQNESN